MNGKVIGGVVALIVVVGAVCGIIAGVSYSGSGKKDGLSTASKSVAAVCNPTDYKEQCIESLSSLAQNGSATPKDYIQAAISYTLKQVEIAMNRSGGMGQMASSERQKMAVEDCKDLLQFAVDELQASFSMVGDAQMHTLQDKEAELQDWLSAVISYQQSCLDGMEQPELKLDMSNGLLNATQLTSNALAIVSAITEIFGTYNIPMFDSPDSNSNLSLGSGPSPSLSPSTSPGPGPGPNPTLPTAASSRRLLDTEKGKGGREKAEQPSWLSAADRKLLQSPNSAKPNVIVAQDGSGQFKTIGEGLAAYPKGHKGRFVIYVKAGVYDEYVTVTKHQLDVFMYGDGPEKTIVTGSKSYASGTSTFKTAPFSAIGFGFICRDMGFRNTAGPSGHQAVALRVQSDRSAFYNCKMEGYQDTLYTQAHRQFYSNCVISGTVDFIFGDASVIIQNSRLIVRKPLPNQKNIITAHGRLERHEVTGLVIQNCVIEPEPQLMPTRLETKSYLGRPWKNYSRTIIMESSIGDLIQPEGWLPWDGPKFLDTLFYAEYGNRGPGASTARRVNWKGYKVIDQKEAQQYTVQPFIQGNTWLPNTGAPFFVGFTNPKDFL